MGDTHRSEGVDVDRELGIAFEFGLPEVVITANDAGVVDRHVDAADLVEHRRSGVGNRIEVADVDDVAAHLGRPAGEIVERIVECRLVDIEQHDGRCVLGGVGPLIPEIVASFMPCLSPSP